jgi:Na+-driven multidrug efflux pump
VLIFFRVEKPILNLLENYLHIALAIPLLTGITLPLEQLIFSLNKNKQYIALTMASTSFNIIAMSLLMHYFGLLQVFFLLIVTEASLITAYYFILKPYFSKAKDYNI